MAASSWLTIPNLLSLLRLALVPVFLWLRFTEQPEWAFVVFIIASVSDVVDGFLARVLDQRSKLGGILDPVADKLLVFSAILTLVVSGALPLWLMAVILFRDGLLAIGAVVVRLKKLEVTVQPSRIGKYATFTLVLTIVLALADASPRAPDVLRGYVIGIAFIAALCVVISSLQYWARFGYVFFTPERKQPSPDEERPPAPREPTPPTRR